MHVTKDQIIAALPSLGQNDLTAIRAVIGSLQQQGATQQPTLPENSQGWVFVAIQGMLGIDAAYMADGVVKQLNKHGPEFVGFINQHWPERMKRKADGIFIMTRLLELVEADLKEKRVPVTMLTLVNNLGRIKEIFETAFPGYLASSLTGIVWRRSV